MIFIRQFLATASNLERINRRIEHTGIRVIEVQFLLFCRKPRNSKALGLNISENEVTCAANVTFQLPVTREYIRFNPVLCEPKLAN